MSSYCQGLVFSPLGLKTAFRCCLVVIALGPMTARGDDAARPLSRLVPAQGLTFYFEYEGLRAHAAAWKATAAHEILCETPAGAALVQAGREMVDQLLKAAPQGSSPVQDFLALEDHVVQHGFAAGYYQDDQKSHWVVVLNDFGGEETKGRFNRLLRTMLEPGAGRPLARTNRVRGRDLQEYRKKEQSVLESGHFTETAATWWFEGNALVFVSGPDSVGDDKTIGPQEKAVDSASAHQGAVKAVLDTIDEKSPSGSAHPGVTAARAEGRDLAGFEPNGLLVVEPTLRLDVLVDPADPDAIRWPKVDGQMNELALLRLMGLAPAGRLVGRWGFRGKALLTDLRLESPEPRKGMVGMVDPAGFDKNRLPPIPAGAGAFAVASLHKGLDLETRATLRSVIAAEYRPFVEAAARALENARNRQAVEGVYGRLGSTYCLYYSAWEGDGFRKRDEAVSTLLIGSRDIEALAKSLDAAAVRLNAYFHEQETGKVDAPKPGDRPPALVLERLLAPDHGYRLISPEGRAPWLGEGVEPTLLLGKSYLVVALNPTLARRAVAAEGSGGKPWRRTGETDKQFACLPEKLAFLAVGNPRDSSWPEVISALHKSPVSTLGAVLGFDLGNAPADAPGSDFLGLLGVRKPTNSSPETRRPQGVKAKHLSSLIFPSILAATVDDRGVRVISLEAIPLACIGIGFEKTFSGLTRTINMSVKFTPGE